LELSGFRVLESLGSNKEIEIYRVIRIIDNVSMIAKTTKDMYAGGNVVTTLQGEFEQLIRLQGQGVLVPYSMEWISGRPVLLLQDYKGITLKQMMSTRRATMHLSELLNVAIAIVNCIRYFHNAGVIIHELNPFYLLVSEDFTQVKLLDLRASQSSSAHSRDTSIEKINDDMLPYLSPEQTGRTGIVADFQTDIYSIGVILYEWFSRSLPFQSEHTLDIVYHHLASIPEPIYEKHPSIPIIVSNIVSKCMEKMPEQRYLSAYGLLSDLEECLTQLRASGKVQPFMLGQQDIAVKVLLSQDMLGRQLEQQRLLETLQRVFSGATEVIWINGKAEIGKTTLVLETMSKAIPYKNCIAIGTCEYTNVFSPYYMWGQVMEQLVTNLLNLNRLQQEVWKMKIMEKIQGAGSLLLEIVPLLESLIGKQASVEELSPAESKTKLHYMMKQFIQLFCSQDQPLVLFFDDLQWGDEASLQFLLYLLGEKETQYLFIVGAYREKEMSPDRIIQFQELEEQGISTTWIDLKAFEHKQIQHILTHLLEAEKYDMEELAKLVLNKTEGNPYSIRQFLQDLLVSKLLHYDERSRDWTWDALKIEELSVRENVVEKIARSLKKLSQQNTYILGRAAFLGNKFNLDELAIITKLSLEQLLEWAEMSVQDRIFQIVQSSPNMYRFQHYDIQRVASELVPIAERSNLHTKIGMMMYERMRAGANIKTIDILHHWNQAIEQVVSVGYLQDLVKLNIHAGLEAKDSLSFETALSYLTIATELLGAESWDNDYILTYQAFKERAELEVLCAHFEKADELYLLLLEKAWTDLDKVQICIQMIQLEMNKDQYTEVIALGEKAMALLGYRHTYHPSKLELVQQTLRVRWKLRKHSIEAIAELPSMTDEKHKSAMIILAYTSDASFSVNKEGWYYLILTMLEKTLDFGLVPEASQAFASYAFILNYKFYDFEASYRWGMLACKVASSNPALYIKVYTTVTICYDSWRKYEPEFLIKYNDRIDKAYLQAGDIWSANYSMIVNCGLLMLTGHPLHDIYSRLLSHVPKFQQNNDGLHWKQAAILSELIRSLTGYRSSNDPFAAIDITKSSFLENTEYDSAQFLEELINVNQYIRSYLFGDTETALEAVERCFNIIQSRNEELMDSSSHSFYYVLVLKELCEKSNWQEKKDYMSKLQISANKLKKMAARSPHNYLHKALLAKAEIARLKLKYRQAAIYYEQAIDASYKNGHIHDAAIIAECYGQYGIRNGKEHIARVYMNEAYDYYMQWGAILKAEDMEAKYGHLIRVKRKSDLERVDYLAVVMSTQVLTGEMEMGQLLLVLMRIMIQNAGAEYGALIFDYEGEWFIEAHGTLEQIHIKSIQLDHAEHLIPTEIIGHTVRTKEEIVLHNAGSRVMFESSEYSKNKELRSVLCLPILHQNKLLGILYMENNLSSGVFSKERVDVLKLLASQCAISIMNARLYADMQQLKNSLEEQVWERTRTLEKSMQATSDALAETTVYAERNRIAQEIHDIVGHTLTSTILQIEAGKRLLHKDMDSAVIRLKEAQDLVRHSLNEIRNSVHMLKEDKYYDIEAALMQLIQSTSYNTGAVIHAVIDPISHLSYIQKKVIYHALQEGLTNGIRHGNSTEFHFSLTVEGALLQFRLADNGIGSSNIVMGFGLKMMRDRIQQLKGNLYIDAELNKGFLLRMSLPNEA